MEDLKVYFWDLGWEGSVVVISSSLEKAFEIAKRVSRIDNTPINDDPTINLTILPIKEGEHEWSVGDA